MATTAHPATTAYLHAHGISVEPRELGTMVREAVDGLLRDLHRPDPRRELSPSEVEVLERGGFDLGVEERGAEDPLARTTALYSALLETGYTTGEAAELLGVDPSRLRHRLTSQPPSLYGVRLESGWSIPRFQFDGDRLFPGLGEVVAELDPELHPVSVYRWFTTPNPDLVAERLQLPALSPREWLRLGLPAEKVADLASTL